MAEPNDTTPFQMQVGYDQPELLGARWWHEGMRAPIAPSFRGAGTASADESRRTALKILVLAGGGVLIAGMTVTQCDRRGTETTTIDHESLALQKAQGLDWQAKDVPFLWGAGTTDTTADGKPLDPGWLSQLTNDLAPADDRWRPFYVPTLFQSLTATGNTQLFRGFQMVNTSAMQLAFRRGEAIRELLAAAQQPDALLLVIDLPGADSVAFAAALAPATTVVFGFDNWPHPRGVVPAHRTLGAAVYHRASFTRRADAAATARPAAIVLDRDRLTPYQNDASRFDNRYRAKLPPAAELQRLGVQRVLYVAPEDAAEQELDDCNARFVEYRSAGITVQLLGLVDVKPETGSGTTAARRYYWHGSPGTHWWFWNHYGWASRPAPLTPERPTTRSFGSTWQPTARNVGIARLGHTEEQRTTTRSGGSWGRSSGGYSG